MEQEFVSLMTGQRSMEGGQSSMTEEEEDERGDEGREVRHGSYISVWVCGCVWVCVWVCVCVCVCVWVWVWVWVWVLY